MPDDPAPSGGAPARPHDGAPPSRPAWWPELTPDGWLLFATYSVRLCAYAFVSVVLGLYLAELGLETWAIGLVFTAALAGGGVMTGLLTLVADRFGRRRVLIIGAALMAVAGAVFALTSSLALLIAAAVLGTISPSGSEVGPFLSIEQAMLPQTTRSARRTAAFTDYNVIGSAIGALGSLTAGLPAVLGLAPLAGYRALLWAYAAVGMLLLVLFARHSDRVEAPSERAGGQTRPAPINERGWGVRRSRWAVAKLSGLSALDSFGSGFVVQGIVSYWFHLRYGIDVKGLGAIAAGTDVLAAASFLAAPWLAQRVGLLKAAIFSHLVANVLVVLVPLMPTMPLAVGAWLARYLVAQMERPARQSYTMAILDAHERAAASGIMSVARNAAAAIAPSFAGATLAAPALGLPFLFAGGLKLLYDGAFYLLFRGMQPPEETPTAGT